MNTQVLTLEHEYSVNGLHCTFCAAGGVPVVDALDAATDRLEAVLSALAGMMCVGEVSQQATLAYYAAESALALVYASHAGVEAAAGGES